MITEPQIHRVSRRVLGVSALETRSSFFENSKLGKGLANTIK